LRAAAARVVGEGFLDALKSSPFGTTLVLVAAPTRLTVCDPSRLATSLQRHHARYAAAQARGSSSRGCDGMVALLNGAPLGPSQRFGLPLTALVVAGRGFLRTWRHLYSEYAALGAVAPQHSLREALLLRVATTASENLLVGGPTNASGASRSAASEPLAKGGYDDDGAAAQTHAVAGEAPEANGGCFACGGGGRAAEGAPSCRAALCGRGCAIAFNCSDDPREVRWAAAHTGAASPDAAAAGNRGGAMAGSSYEERAVTWGLLHGETCALRAAVTPPHAAAALSPLARSALWHAHVDDQSGNPSALELAARAKRSNSEAARAVALKASSAEGSSPSEGSPKLMCAVASSTGEARGFGESDSQGTKPLARRRRFLVATVAAPDEDAMSVGGAAREPWLEYAAAKQAYARQQGYPAELLLPGRVLLGGVSGDPHAILGPSRAGLLTRCEALRPLLALDALLRHGSQSEAVDYVLITDHATFVSPLWFNSSLDAFVEVSP
jgi:hypothetical protein